jgi:hypothetical protein
MKFKLLLIVSLSVIFSLSINTALAQDVSVCEAQGFGDTGCLKCVYNGAVESCGLQDTAVPGVACLPGTTAPVGNICGEYSDIELSGQCNATYIPCVPVTVPEGGFFCDTSELFNTCQQCDFDDETPFPECPSSTAPYTTYSDCLLSCELPTDDTNSCVASNGICRTSCGETDELISGVNCPLSGQLCCRPTNEPPNTAALVACNNTLGTVDTAIGCIPFDLINQTARFFLSWSLSIGGGVALLLVGVSGIMFATSSGNPKRIENAKSLFYAAITGLLMIVLSIFLLRFIGVNVIGLFS